MMNPVKDDVWQQDDPCNDDWKFTIYIYIDVAEVYGDLGRLHPMNSVGKSSPKVSRFR